MKAKDKKKIVNRKTCKKDIGNPIGGQLGCVGEWDQVDTGPYPNSPLHSYNPTTLKIKQTKMERLRLKMQRYFSSCHKRFGHCRAFEVT